MKILCAVLEQDDLGKHSHRRTYSQSSGTQDPQFMPQVWCFYYCIHWLVTLTGTLPLPPDVELSQDSNHAHPVILFPAQRHFTLWCNNIMNERKNECILVTKVFLSHQVIVLWGKKANEKDTSKKSCVQDCFLCLLTFSYEAWPLWLVEHRLLLKDILPLPSQKEGEIGCFSKPTTFRAFSVCSEIRRE